MRGIALLVGHPYSLLSNLFISAHNEQLFIVKLQFAEKVDHVQRWLVFGRCTNG